MAAYSIIHIFDAGVPKWHTDCEPLLRSTFRKFQASTVLVWNNNYVFVETFKHSYLIFIEIIVHQGHAADAERIKDAFTHNDHLILGPDHI